MFVYLFICLFLFYLSGNNKFYGEKLYTGNMQSPFMVAGCVSSYLSMDRLTWPPYFLLLSFSF